MSRIYKNKTRKLARRNRIWGEENTISGRRWHYKLSVKKLQTRSLKKKKRKSQLMYFLPWEKERKKNPEKKEMKRDG